MLVQLHRSLFICIRLFWHVSHPTGITYLPADVICAHMYVHLFIDMYIHIYKYIHICKYIYVCITQKSTLLSPRQTHFLLVQLYWSLSIYISLFWHVPHTAGITYLPADVMRFYKSVGVQSEGLKRLILDGNRMSWLPNYLRNMTTLTHIR